MKINVPYTLHDFLDRELAPYHGSAPEHIVREKKKEYKKLYAGWYNQFYRERMRQVTLQFPVSEFNALKKQAKEHRIRLSNLIKSLMKGKVTSADGHQIRTQLLLLLDIIEECMYESEYTRLTECCSIVESMLKNYDH